MENKNTILDELKNISLVVASIGNQNPYTPPQGYFDGLAVQVMLRIAIEEKAGADPVLNINKDNTYQAPEHYFDNLAGNIMNRIKAQETGNAKEELELLSPLLGQIGKKNPFTSPEGYFNDFSENIVAGVKAIEFVNEELENLSPTMLSLKKKQVYEVPDGYFDNTASVILNKAKQQQPAKVISIGFGKKIMRYAAAAVVIGIVATSSWIYFKPVSTTDTIAGIVDKVKNASDDEILNFTENNTASVADTAIITTDDDISYKDSKDLLANISDEELQQYADQQHIETQTPLTN